MLDTDVAPDPSSILDLPRIDAKGYQDKAIDLQKAKIATDTRIMGATEGAVKRDRQMADSVWNAQGVTLAHQAPWDADQQREKFSTNPIEAFGSYASVFGIMASAFTGHGLASALSASGAAMQAIKAKDDQGYERAFAGYKENMALLEKRFNMQHTMYTEAIQRMNTDMTLGETQLKNAMVRFGDQKGLALLEAGMMPELFTGIKAQADAMVGMSKAAEATDKTTFQKKMFQQQVDQLTPEQQNDPKALQRIFNSVYNIQPVQQQEAAMIMADPKITEKEKLQKLEALTHAQRPYRISEKDAAVDALMKKRAEEGTPIELKDAIAEVEGGIAKAKADAKPYRISEKDAAVDALMKKRAEEGTPIELKDAIAEVEGGIAKAKADAKPSAALAPRAFDVAWIQRRAEELRQENPDISQTKAEDMATRERADAKKNFKPGASIDEDTLDELADQAIAGDTSVFTNLGRGQQGAGNIIALRKRIAEKLTAKGQDGAQQARNVAGYQGDRAAARSAGTRDATITMPAIETIKMMAVARSDSANLPRTRWTPINEGMQAIRYRSSDPALAKFITSTNAVVNTYVRAISPTGVPTDEVRKHAWEMLNTAQGPDAYDAVLQTMETELQSAIAAPREFKKMLLQGTNFDPSKGPGSEGVNVIHYDNQGNRVP